MNKNFKIVENHIELDKLPAKFKKMTGTRFATVLGLNVWSTPFEVWCALTRTYEKPFEDTIYTKAGKVIEPKIIEYLKSKYFMDIKSPVDVYGENYFQQTWGDFFPQQTILGGSWDAIGEDFVVEIKTSSRPQDWEKSIPLYYKLQACLYAYLLGFDNVIMTASFLSQADYTNPENFEPSVENTKVYEFSLQEEYPNFKAQFIDPAVDFWNNYVLTGISPDFDEKKDADILKELRKHTVPVEDTDFKKILNEADKLQLAIDKAEDRIQEKKDRLKELDGQIKKYMGEQFRDGDKKVEIESKHYTWTLTKATRKSVDTTALKNDGLYEEYLKESTTQTLRKTRKEETA